MNKKTQKDPLTEIFGEPISVYTRAQALEDGCLVDVTETAQEAGFQAPVALTKAAWERYIAVPKELEGVQDEPGRLWDALFMLGIAIQRKPKTPVLLYQVTFQMPDRDWHPRWEHPTDGQRELRTVTLKSVCGPGDHAEPVITIMLPEED